MKNTLIALSVIICTAMSCTQKATYTEPQYGQLSVSNGQLVGSDSTPIVLRGVSYGWHTWWPRFYNAETVKWLKDDWHCNIVRAAMGVKPDSSYLTHPDKALSQITAVIDGALENGLYVIVDWHSHGIYTAQAKDFFSQMAKKYQNCPNIIWEIFNEPVIQPWEDIKEYATTIISEIRAQGSNNVILVGCPHWDQDIDKVAANPIIGFNNIMYTVHFYADTHKQWLRDRCDSALALNIPIFISESGVCNANGDGEINAPEWNTWIDWCETNKISWITWMVADKEETCSLLCPSANSTGNWTENDLTEGGIMTRNKIIELNK